MCASRIPISHLRGLYTEDWLKSHSWNIKGLYFTLGVYKTLPNVSQGDP